MSTTPPSADGTSYREGIDDRLDAAIAEFLDAEARGEAIDRGDFLARHAEVAEGLKVFLSDHERMLRAAAPLRGLVGGTSPSLGGDALLQPTMPLASAGASSHASFALSSASHDGQERVGRYRLLGEAGRGGMGVVYKAVDEELGRTVALKMIPSGRLASSDDLERFRNEARLAAGLQHPGIVPIYEADHHQGLPFFAMAYVEGISLAERLREGPLPPLEAARMLKKIAAAVAYAHSQGVIHRDLKPANILLSKVEGASGDSQGDLYEPAITDFGLAKRLGGDVEMTTTGQIMGTPAYMPPEQAAGNRPAASRASDIYSLGALLYAMLTGRPPFVAANFVEVVLQVLENDPPLPRKLNPNVPRELEAICLKCLEKRPERRYESAAALAEDLERILRREPPEAGKGSLLSAVRRWGRREPVGAWHVGGLLVILALTQVIYLFHWHDDLAYHWRVSGLIGLWIVACLGLQQARQQPRLREWIQYVWSATDAFFLAALLASLVGPLGLLMSGFAALVGASGLFFRVRLVAFTTGVSMLGALTVLIMRPEESPALHYILFYLAALAILGLVVGYQVWRFGVLREYYEDRRD
jgi:eukaryotic-like serine/threonine-protein kinase